jgi:hypothetical protein
LRVVAAAALAETRQDGEELVVAPEGSSLNPMSAYLG